MPRNLTAAMLLALLVLPRPAASQAFTRALLDSGGYMGEWLRAAPSRDSLPFLAYYDFDIKGVKTLKCGNRACDSGNVFALLDTVGLMGWHISLTIPPDGRPLISHFDVHRGDLRVIRCGTPDCASGNKVTAADTVGETGRFSSLALDRDGIPVLAYFDATRGDLRVMACGDTACSQDNVTSSPDTAGTVGLHASVAVGKGGTPLIAYMDGTRGDLKYLECADRACQGTPTVVRLDTVGLTGQFAQLVLDRDGLPVIAYLDFENRLKLVRCGNAGCLSGNRFTLLTGEPVWGRPSLALDAAGLPVVAYAAAGSQDLRVVRCRDGGCNNTSHHLIDSAGEKGQYSSLYFDGDGKPFLAYFDSGPFDVWAAWCPGSDCWTGSPLRAGRNSPLRPSAAAGATPFPGRAWRLPWENGFRDARGRSAR